VGKLKFINPQFRAGTNSAQEWTTSIEELMTSLHAVVESGKVLYLGASDLPAWVVSAANTWALAHGKTPFSVYQGRWSILDRDLERDIIPMCRHFGMAIAPWGVLGGGKLQTEKQMEERKAKGEGIRNHAGGRVDTEQTENEKKMSAALEKVADEVGVDSIQVSR
jgi:aryl-alcohol dehydrogenase-like predicted oxidoreductase